VITAAPVIGVPFESTGVMVTCELGRATGLALLTTPPEEAVSW